jgi:hypothetical protein
MSIDRKVFPAGFHRGIPRLGPLAAKVTSEAGFLHAAMHAGLFERLEGGSLGVSEPGLDAAFGENPASLTGLDQEELDDAAAHPITNRRHLFALLKLAQFRQPEKFG